MEADEDHLFLGDGEFKFARSERQKGGLAADGLDIVQQFVGILGPGLADNEGAARSEGVLS